jgi:hypothetical protein
VPIRWEGPSECCHPGAGWRLLWRTIATRRPSTFDARGRFRQHPAVVVVSSWRTNGGLTRGAESRPRLNEGTPEAGWRMRIGVNVRPQPAAGALQGAQGAARLCGRALGARVLMREGSALSDGSAFAAGNAYRLRRGLARRAWLRTPAQPGDARSGLACADRRDCHAECGAEQIRSDPGMVRAGETHPRSTGRAILDRRRLKRP